jgi:hemolysin activation/secretion protein
LYRIGGNETVRGYSEQQFAFKTALFGQIEYLFYLTPNASAYLFLDGGVGFPTSVHVHADDRKNLLGYGIGVRIPVRIGTASIAWARNYRDTKSMGRIHVRITNALAESSLH